MPQGQSEKTRRPATTSAHSRNFSLSKQDFQIGYDDYASFRFHKRCDGTRNARLNLLEAFSHAMVAVSSTSASSSKNLFRCSNISSVTSRPVMVMASAYSSATFSFSVYKRLVEY